MVIFQSYVRFTRPGNRYNRCGTVTDPYGPVGLDVLPGDGGIGEKARAAIRSPTRDRLVCFKHRGKGAYTRISYGNIMKYHEIS